MADFDAAIAGAGGWVVSHALCSNIVLAAPPTQAEEVPVALNVTFVQPAPDLRQDVPAVPG